MYLSQFRYSHLLEKGVALHLNKLECPSPKDALLQDWLKLDRWFWRWRFFNFVNVFLLFCYYLPLEKVGALHLNKLESSSPKNAMWQVWFEIGTATLEKKFLFKICSSIFAIIYYLHLKRTGLFIWTNLNLIQRCFVPSLVKIGLVVLVLKISKFCYWISTISLLFPLRKWRGHSLNKLELPLRKNALCKVWLKWALCDFGKEDF